MNIHLISLKQDIEKQFGDLEDLDEGQGLDFNFLQGQVEALEHILDMYGDES
jgi:hypothetical protein